MATGVVVSVGNSTTTPLAGGATFTGVGENVTKYQDIDVNAYAVPDTPDRIFFEFSPDNVNWDLSTEVVLTTVQPMTTRTFRTTLPYFRVRYVNNIFPQGAFRLTTTYRYATSAPLAVDADSLATEATLEDIRTELKQTDQGVPTAFIVSNAALQICDSSAQSISRVITNNGTSNIYLGGTAGVAVSGPNMGIKLVPRGTYTDSGPGVYTGEIWAIGDTVAAVENVSVWERSFA